MGAVKRNTLSVLFIIKKAKLLKNGEAPICMRITVNKRVAEVMIKCQSLTKSFVDCRLLCYIFDKLSCDQHSFFLQLRTCSNNRYV